MPTRTGVQFAVVILVLSGAFTLMLARTNLFVAYADPVGIQYTGSGACAAAACHGNAAPAAVIFNVNVIWHEKDPHSRAMMGDNGLNNARAKAIAKNLNIDDPAKANACLMCHSTSALTLNPPIGRAALQPNQRGNRFDPAEGVSCDGCHGPAGKRIEPHVAAGWAQAVQARGVNRMFDEWGMLALKDAHMRANSCVSCHLHISPAVVDAGHPELRIEMGDYNAREWAHWRDNKPWFAVRLWAVGQAVSLRDAAQQLRDRTWPGVNPQRRSHAYKQLIAHALQTRQAASVIQPDALNAIDAQLKEVHGNWNNPEPLRRALHDLYAVAEKFAAHANRFEFNAENVTRLRAGVAAEAESAGAAGNFPACEMICYALLSLNGALAAGDAEPANAHENEVGELFEHGSIEEVFNAAKYSNAAQRLKAKLKQGEAIALPPNAPKE